jgi:DNA replication protein DnaC
MGRGRQGAVSAGLSWPPSAEMTDAVIEAKLFADAGTKQGHRRQVEPDWASIIASSSASTSRCRSSQIPVDKWHELIGDPTYADAILDRIVHNAHRINLTGHSLRRSRANKASKE